MKLSITLDDLQIMLNAQEYLCGSKDTQECKEYSTLVDSLVTRKQKAEAKQKAERRNVYIRMTNYKLRCAKERGDKDTIELYTKRLEELKKY